MTASFDTAKKVFYCMVVYMDPPLHRANGPYERLWSNGEDELETTVCARYRSTPNLGDVDYALRPRTTP